MGVRSFPSAKVDIGHPYESRIFQEKIHAFAGKRRNPFPFRVLGERLTDVISTGISMEGMFFAGVFLFFENSFIPLLCKSIKRFLV